jgi:hypothetical protein
MSWEIRKEPSFVGLLAHRLYTVFYRTFQSADP